MYTVSEVVEIGTAQNLIREVTIKCWFWNDDIFTLSASPETDFDE